MARMVIPSELDRVPVVVEAIVGAVSEAGGYSERCVFAVRLAVDEAVTNAIRHGNGQDPDKSVTVEYEVGADRLSVSICDEGSGFKPEELPDPTEPENLIRTHGRGVMLMHAYMTEVTYSAEGNCVTLVKTRDCGKPEAD